ncbi:MAG: class I SAM-dependent methyltransferase [Candidatus Zixiibacteriota bacterium]
MPHEDHEKNRTAWNEMAEVHYKHPDYRVREFLDGAITLHPIELRELGDVTGKTLLHLFCQFGLDTLSWARMGAAVTGVDISDTSIEYANILAKKANLAAKFVRSDVLDLEGKLDETFDIVFQSYGTHCWIHDVERWAEVVAGHLKPGGVFYIVDFHPVGAVWLDDDTAYFKKGPYRVAGQPDYCDREYIIKNELVEWQHKLADIVNAFIKAGLTIEFLNEYEGSIDAREKNWIEKDGYYYPPEGSSPYPLTFSLKAIKAR